ncbi:MAG TPA: AI-2E family transporter [Actinomycetes bacterium]
MTGLVGAAAAVAVLVGISLGAGVVAPVMLALILTIAVVPVAGIMRRRGVPSWAATLTALVLAYLIVLFLVVGVAASIVQLAALLPQYTDRAQDLQTSATDNLASAGLSSDQVRTAISQIDPATLGHLLGSLLSGVLGVLSSLFFLVTVMFFLVTEASGMGRRVARLAQDRPDLAAALAGFVGTVQRYLVVTALFGMIVAVLDTGALWLLGVPLPLMWGLLSFLTNFVPNIGFVIGLIPPALLALLDSGVQKMVAVILVYCILNVTIQTFIQPRFVGDAVGLSPAVTFLSLAVWTLVLGPIGALLAVPMSLLARTLLIDANPGAEWARVLVSEGPVKDGERQAPVEEHPVEDGVEPVPVAEP